MQEQDKPNFETLMNATASMYGRKPSDRTQLMMYFNALSRFCFEDVQAGFNSHIQNPDNGQFFPKPADIIRYMDGNSETKSGEAWTKLDKAIRTVGPYQNVIFDDSIIHAVVSDMGGWLKICGVDEDSYPFIRNEFVKRYTGYANRPPETYQRILTGIAQQSNDMRNLGTTEKPMAIGHRDTAVQVYLNGSDKPEKTVHRISFESLNEQLAARLESK